MLDTTSTAATLAWQDTLNNGDVVAFRFPVAEFAGKEAAKVRPCLVLDVETIMGVRFAILAYGTTSKRNANIGYEVRVWSEDLCEIAGLRQPTRFVGARRIMVPLDHDGFDIYAVTGSPVLGRLTGAAFKRMNAVRAAFMPNATSPPTGGRSGAESADGLPCGITTSR